jgi:Arylsulfatase A and related enzymes
MKKNLLYVFADQWRYHAIGYAGEDRVLTPHMDAFAAEALAFTNAISTYPLCSPHRAALLTGKNPLSCGFWTNSKSGVFLSPTLAPQEITLGDILKSNGYSTAYVGKWHLDSSDLNHFKHPVSGAVNWDAYTPPGERRHGFDFWHSYGAMDKHLNPHYWENSPKMLKYDKWSPTHEREVLERWLKNGRDKDKPFAAVLSWNPPHPPYDQVPDEFRPLYSKEKEFRKNVPEEWKKDSGYLKKFEEYYAAVSGLDKEFGLLIDYLKKNGLYDNTVIVLSADHGDMMGSHALYGKNIWYEESIRIPLYIRDPEMKSARLDNLVESCDQLPTLLDLLSIPVPETVEGISALRSDKDMAFLCMLPGMPELIEPFKRLGLDSASFGWRGIRTKEFTYVIDNGTAPGVKQRRLYYDNVNDPYQLSPILLDREDEICKKLDPRLRAWCESQKDFFLFERKDLDK